jgi:membrane protease YdiL (CAAX protease family)
MHTADRRAGVPFSVAASTWAVCWFVGNIVGSVIVGAARSDAADTGSTVGPIWATLIAAAALWSALVAGLVWVSGKYGTGSLTADLGLRFAPIDLVGIPLGVFCQLVLLQVVYWPLRSIWPVTFDEGRIETSARNLYDSANGAWLVGLVLVVVVGAPLVEELVYRGLLQRSVAQRLPGWIAVVLVAGWFALIHFRPVEYPGLFAFGLVLGAMALVTRRLGMAVLAHCAFNATGLLWVARR